MGYYINKEKDIGEMSIDELVEDMKHNPFLANIDTNILKNYGKEISEKFTRREEYKIPKEIFMPVHNQIREKTKLKHLTDASIQVQMGRYLKKDDYYIPTELPEDMFKRVAVNIAQADRIYDKNANIEEIINEFSHIMANCEYEPNSPTLMNAGREIQQLSGCYVLPVDDSIEDIFNAFKYTALIQKSGGGTGFSFCRLRPKNDIVKSTMGISSGPLSFIKIFNSVTDGIKQGGTRRGANMGILPVYHPDVMDFIHAKDYEGVLENFNLSVGITEDFVEKAMKGKDYDLINPRTRKVVGRLNAKKVLDDIIESAHRKGDPGIIFLDRLNMANPTPEVGEIESTNPCGEQPLLPYESCNLGSINLGKFVENKKINYDHLGKVAKQAIHFLDNVIDMNKYPLKEIDKVTKANRKVGFGVMGWADMLVKLNISYDSLQALRKAEEVMSFIQSKAKEASAELAEKRGNFPNYEKSIYKDYGPMRNATVTTIAPTGTIGVIAGASQGIEPFFKMAYFRHTPQFELLEKSESFIEIAKQRGFYSDDLIKITEDEKGKKKAEVDFSKVPEDAKEIFVTAHEISPEQQLSMQSAFQKYVDNAVSKTVNFRSDATIEDVKKAYRLAYTLGNIRGVTIYVDKSRSKQVITTGEEGLEGKLSDSGRGIVRVNIERPEALEVLHAKKYSSKTASGRVHITISDQLYEAKDGRKYWIPYEKFCGIKPLGSELSAKTAVGGLKDSYIFQGDDPPYISLITNLKSVKTSQKAGFGEKAVFSLDHAEGLAIEYHLLTNGIIGYDENKRLEQKVSKKDMKKLDFDPMNIGQKVYEIENGKGKKSRMNVIGNIKIGEEICIECGSTNVRHAEGCHGIICMDCGYDSCS